VTTAVSLLDGEEGWALQMGFWHYAVQGNIGETAALIAEGHADLVSQGSPWDRTAADLAHETISRDGEPYRRVRDVAALPWVMEHAIRKHIPWPGL
jgi:hypothetical protein